jgi:hypothetical protein
MIEIPVEGRLEWIHKCFFLFSSLKKKLHEQEISYCLNLINQIFEFSCVYKYLHLFTYIFNFVKPKKKLEKSIKVLKCHKPSFYKPVTLSGKIFASV